MPPKTIINCEDDFSALDQALGIWSRPIYRLLAAILHMGNVNFENNDSGCAQIAETSNESFECAANLLKISNTQLKNALLCRKFTVERQDNSEHYTMPNDIIMAARTKETIMKQIYHGLFEFLIGKINESSHTKSQKYIGILDIAGFGK